jgi:hypothetical protein
MFDRYNIIDIDEADFSEAAVKPDSMAKVRPSLPLPPTPNPH